MTKANKEAVDADRMQGIIELAKKYRG